MEAFSTLFVPPESPLLAIFALLPGACSTSIPFRLHAEDSHGLEIFGTVLIAECTDSSPVLLALWVAHVDLLLLIVFAVVEAVSFPSEIGRLVAGKGRELLFPIRTNRGLPSCWS